MSKAYETRQPSDSVDTFVRDIVERYRAKILDLSSRNPLIDFKHSERARSHIRVVNEIPEILLSKLSAGRQLTFVPVSEPPLFPTDENTPEFQNILQKAKREDHEYQGALTLLGPNASDRQKKRAERELRDRLRSQLNLPPFESAKDARKRAVELGIPTDYDLPRFDGQSARHFTDLKIQTLYFPDDLNRKLSKLREAAHVLLNDAGINALYCAFGFLEYYETTTTGARQLAPLVFYPIELDRELEVGEYRYFVRPTGDDVKVNVALAELLRRQCTLEVPAWEEPEEDVNPLEQYFASLERIICSRPDWRLRRYVTIGLYNFSTLAMYEDLDPKHWSAIGPIEKHPIVRTIVAGAEVHGSGFALDYELDSLSKPDALLVTDADSSQHSAVIDVLQGKDCVIQGPPGTGKSQTITNIVSAALHSGKTVLFVAEKMAALEVVEKRLNAAGLEHFCLELHSTKTSKAVVIASLASRLAYRGPRLSHQRVESNLDELERTRKALIYYVQKAREPAGKTGLSVYEVLLGSAKREASRGQLPSTLATTRIPNALDISEHRRRDMVAAAGTLETQAAPLKTFGRLADHPWRGLQNTEITDLDSDELAGRLQTWTVALEAIKSITAGIERQTDSKLPTTVANLIDLCNAIAGLGDPPNDAVDELLPRLATQENARRLETTIGGLEEILACEQQLGTFCKDAASIETVGSGPLAKASKTVLGLGIKDTEVGQLRGILQQWQDRCSDADRAQKSASFLARAFGLEDEIIASLRASVVGTELLQLLPRVNWGMRTAATLDERNEAFLRERAERCAMLKKRRAVLETRIEIAALPVHQELRQCAIALRAANPITALFRSDCRTARRLFRSASRGVPRKLNRLQLAEELSTWANYLKDESDFVGDRQAQQMCGLHFKGLESPFPTLVEVSIWARSVRTATAGHGSSGTRIRECLFSADADQLDAITGWAKGESFAALKRIVDAFPEADRTLAQLKEQEAERAETLSQAISLMESAGLLDEVPFNNLPKVVSLLETIERRTKEIESNQTLRAMLPGAVREAKSKIAALKSTWSYADRLNKAKLPDELKKWLFIGLDQLPTAREWSRHLGTKLSATQIAEAAFASMARIHPMQWSGHPSLDQAPIERLISKGQQASTNVLALRDYIDFLLSEESATEKGLGPILRAYIEANEDYGALPKATDLVLFRSAAEEILSADPKLKRHSGATHEQLRRQYQQLDREYLQLRRQTLAAELVDRYIPDGNSVGRVGDLTELALVRYLAGQTRPRIPLRSLFSRAGRAIQSLKPCWMMSPMSVAQFLESGAVEFDLVVMDEASQIRPEEALGAILRAKQLVVVGDQMQLPPTPFFQKLSLDGATEVEGEEFADEKQDSILESAAARFFPPRLLKWHYRSEHGSLISFSNREFYRNDLTVFPSPFHEHPEYGVRSVFVGGIYPPGGVNQAEIQAVIQAASSFMEKHLDRSLGIVAVNSKQADLIREEMDKLFAKNPQAEAYRARWEECQEGLESFFVKNLENVQGDERDVIFISTVYGADEHGNVHQRFGPINSEYGHRRLNVLFTRAKKQVVVFTSLKPEDIQEVGKYRGVRVLKEYLRYARDGHTAVVEEAGEKPENEFEQWVIDILNAAGFDAVPQLGFAGYRIDIAVRHPTQPGTFICGVECDGASYHSAPSVRERDRLRQEVLERLGWNIYRIWSTDWFRNPALQSRKLIQHLKTLSGCPLA